MIWHLRPIERELVAAGARETDRGQPWSNVRTGRERGLFCREHEDAIIGRHAPGRGMRFPSKRKKAKLVP